MHLNVWITNRDQNSMVTDPQLNPYKFTTGCSVANCTTTPGIDLRDPIPFNRFKQVLQTGYPTQQSSYISMGVSGFKIDRGDQGDIPDALQPTLATLIPKMAYEASFEYNGAEGFTFSRNVYDRGRKYVAVWNGDSDPNLANGMSDSLKQLLRLGAIMISMVGSDTGGYNGTPNKDTFARWMAFSAHVPMMEVLLGPNRTPWNAPHRHQRKPADVDVDLDQMDTGASRPDPIHAVIAVSRDLERHVGDTHDATRVSERSKRCRHVQRIHVRRCAAGGAYFHRERCGPLGISAGRQLDRL
jgi:hypothetical protein